MDLGGAGGAQGSVGAEWRKTIVYFDGTLKKVFGDTKLWNQCKALEINLFLSLGFVKNDFKVPPNRGVKQGT